MRRRFPARHVGGRDARDTAGRNAQRSEIERSPSQQRGHAHTALGGGDSSPSCVLSFARASDADRTPMLAQTAWRRPGTRSLAAAMGRRQLNAKRAARKGDVE
ncbi:hypothetical protein PSPO01_01607 [Paraphaeosphaeria sporulosa]